MICLHFISSHSTHHFHLQKSILSATSGGHFPLSNYSPNYSPNFSQKFDQKLSPNLGNAFLTRFSVKIHITNPTRRAVFTRFFVKKSCETSVLLDQNHIDLIAAIKPFQFFFDDDKAVRLRNRTKDACARGHDRARHIAFHQHPCVCEIPDL